MKKFYFLFVSVFCLLNLNAQMTVDVDWLKGLGSKNGGNDILYATCVDASGNVYIAGQVPDTTDFDPSPASFTLQASNSAFFAKYSPLGSLIWAKVLTGATAVSGCKGIGVDGTGNVYITGNFNAGAVNFDPSASNYTLAPNQNDMFIAKYNSSGSFQWAYSVGALSSVVNPRSMKVQTNGDVFIGGSFTCLGLMNFNPAGPTYTVANNGAADGFIAKYNTSGLLSWAFEIGGPSGDYVYSIDVDAAGNTFAVGEFQGIVDFDPITTFTNSSIGAQDMFFCKYTQSSSLAWAKAIGGTTADGAFRTKLDNNGDLFVSGYMSSTDFDADPVNTYTLSKVGAGANDMFVGKYNGTTGNLMWAQNTGNSNSIMCYGMSIDQLNNLYITGAFDNPTDFDLSVAGSFTLANTTIGGTDIFLAKYGTGGNMIYANHLGGGSAIGNGGADIFVDNSNRIVLTGMHNNFCDLDFSIATNTVQSFGGQDIFFARYTQCITADTPTLTVNSVTMCANSVVTLSIANGNLNSASNWVWALSCGGSTVATGPTATFSPVFATTYFVRGEGGCPTPSNCASATIAITPSKDIQGQALTATTVPVAGYVVLYKYKGPLHLWDSVTYQNINTSGNYTFTSVNSGSYILTCEPTSSSLQITYAPSSVSWKGAIPFTHGCNVNSNTSVNVIPLTNLGSGPGELSGKITEGQGYGHKGTFAPGNPIGGISIKGGKNPGGNIIAQGRTNSSGEYTLSSLPLTGPGESYFILVDIPGLDTNGTYHMAVVTGSTQYSGLDFIVDSMYINPTTGVGIKEMNINDQLVNLYPNPAKDQLTIKIKENHHASVQVKLFDVFGKLIKEERDEQVISEYTSQLALQDLNRGIYFVKIKINDSERTVKLILSE